MTLSPPDRTVLVEQLMADFALSTGLKPEKENPTRYLWTDAFAVCNYLSLYENSGNLGHLDLATRLVDQVHHTLGRHRGDDRRRGWISGLSEREGERHPTAGGLRIGKPLNERSPDEPPDAEKEWEQDGQYFHYLTKWMHALVRMGRTTKSERYVVWAGELAKRAHSAFTFNVQEMRERRMYWKMSVDLSRPLVPSMGQHDPLDGFVTYQEVVAATTDLVRQRKAPPLEAEIADIGRICKRVDILTDDPLGIGGLLSDASRVCQIISIEADVSARLLARILVAASTGLRYFEEASALRLPADLRLAFRELGLAIGMKGVGPMCGTIEANRALFGNARRLDGSLDSVLRHAHIGQDIESFWLKEEHRQASTWLDHRDINTVMLATCLMPDSFLRI